MKKRLKKNILIHGMCIVCGALSLTGCGAAAKKYETVSASEAMVQEEVNAAGKEAESEAESKAELPVIEIEAETKSAEAEAAEAAEKEEPVTFLFAGDIYLSEHVRNAYANAGGIGGVLDETLQAEIASADLFIANQEFPFSDRGTQAPDKQYTFRLPTDTVHMMQEIGTDLVTLANNHALDYGTDALLDTCMVLDKAGILRVGAGADLEEAGRMEVVELNGTRYGFLGASRVFPVAEWAAGANHPGMLSAYDPEALSAVIREAKTRCDYLIVYVHWGIERSTMPENYQRIQGRQYIDAGADMVVGSHPHVLQGIEYYNGKPILYSLGNFIFGSSIPETMLVKAEIETDGSTSLSLIPAASSAGYTRTMEDARLSAFYERMESLSEGIEIMEDGHVVSEGETGGTYPGE